MQHFHEVLTSVNKPAIMPLSRGNIVELKASILIVDEDPNLRKAVSFILRRKGYPTATAKNGQEVVKRMGEGSYNVVFMDLRVLAKEGFSLYQRIREAQPQTGMVLTTRGEMIDPQIKALYNEVRRWLYKPFSMAELFEIVEEFWSGKEKR